MNNSMIGATAGASSPSKLAPETIRIRNALIEKYADQPIEELNTFLQRALEAEKDELKRLGLLAARVYILRQKVLSLKAFIRDERMNSLPTPNLALTEQILLDETAHSEIDVNNETFASGEWHSLQMIEPGEVNGVRFFQGTVINAKAEDAEKLISSGKAIFIDDQGNPVENNADDSEVSDDTADPEADNTDNGIPSDDNNADDPNSVDASVDVNNIDDGNTVDSKASDIDEGAEVDATDKGVPLDDKTADDPNSVDTSVIVDNKDDSNTVDSKASDIDEGAEVDATNDGIALDDKNADDPNVEDAIEDSSEENTKNKDAGGSEETKA
ncbi:MAG: hypothetical protein ACJ0BO_05250 [Candidatus Puniceispirillaceae bacterium]